MKDDTPKPTGRTAAIQITGMAMPWVDGPRGGQPAVLINPAVLGPKIYIPIWDDEVALRASMPEFHRPYDRIKQIEDGLDFLAGLRENQEPTLRLMVNCTFRDGRMRYLEIDPNNPQEAPG